MDESKHRFLFLWIVLLALLSIIFLALIDLFSGRFLIPFILVYITFLGFVCTSSAIVFHSAFAERKYAKGWVSVFILIGIALYSLHAKYTAMYSTSARIISFNYITFTLGILIAILCGYAAALVRWMLRHSTQESSRLNHLSNQAKTWDNRNHHKQKE